MLTAEDLHSIKHLFDDRFDSIDARLEDIDARLGHHDHLLADIIERLDGHDRLLESHGRILENHGRMLESHSKQLAAIHGDIENLAMATSIQFNEVLANLQQSNTTLNDHGARITQLEFKLERLS